MSAAYIGNRPNSTTIDCTPANAIISAGSSAITYEYNHVPAAPVPVPRPKPKWHTGNKKQRRKQW